MRRLPAVVGMLALSSVLTFCRRDASEKDIIFEYGDIEFHYQRVAFPRGEYVFVHRDKDFFHEGFYFEKNGKLKIYWGYNRGRFVEKEFDDSLKRRAKEYLLVSRVAAR